MIRFLLLGTGSSDLSPSPWCACDYCARAREDSGEDQRGFSCALLYPDVLIDCPPDLPRSAVQWGVELYKVRHLLITHSHYDHFSPEVLLLRRSVHWARKGADDDSLLVPELIPLTVYGNSLVAEGCRTVLKEEGGRYDLKIEVRKVKRFEPVRLDERTVVHPLRAAHLGSEGEECFIYLIERDQWAILYATDTGWFPEETWDYLRQFRLDIAVVDATFGIGSATDDHLNVSEAIKLKNALLNNGLLKEEALFAVTHLSPHWTPSYRYLASALQADGVIVGKDGLWLTVGYRNLPSE